MKRQALPEYLLIGVAAFPCLASAADLSYIPSQQRKYPIEQFKVQEPGSQAPVARPVRPLPTNVFKPSDAQQYYDDTGLSFEVKTGWRVDSLHFNIASDITGTATPNILSELTWDQVGSYEVSPKLSYIEKHGMLKGLYMEGSISKSYTQSGENQDSDWLGDNRTLEFSRSNNDSDTGGGSGYSVGIGYAFDFEGPRNEKIMRVLTLIGYAQQKRDFIMTNGNQTIPATGPFAGLHSTYDAQWRAPFVGMEVEWYMEKTHRLNLNGKYYRGQYNAEADWNLRADFKHPKSFEHKANGSGFSLGLEYGWMFSPQMEFTLLGEYTRFETDHGLDIVYHSNNAISVIQLNDADWDSQRYMAGLGYSF